MGRKRKADSPEQLYDNGPGSCPEEEAACAGGAGQGLSLPGLDRENEAGCPAAGDGIDYDLVAALAETHATESEIAAFFGMRVGALRLDPLFSAAYKKGRAAGRLALRRKQCQLAGSNASMAVWLGRQYLGQKDKADKGEKGSQKALTFKLPKEIEELAE